MKYGELNTVKHGDSEYPGFRCKTLTGKVAVLRLPTSAEMIERINSQKTIQRSTGRGQTESEQILNDEADIRLFEQMRLAGDEFNAFEARAAISGLTAADVIEAKLGGVGALITLQTPFGKTIHEVKLPTEKDLHFYRRGLVSTITLRNGQDQLRYRTEVGVELYDAMKPQVEGYAPGVEVPAHHKFAVAGSVSELCKEIDAIEVPNS